MGSSQLLDSREWRQYFSGTLGFLFRHGARYGRPGVDFPLLFTGGLRMSLNLASCILGLRVRSR